MNKRQYIYHHNRHPSGKCQMAPQVHIDSKFSQNFQTNASKCPLRGINSLHVSNCQKCVIATEKVKLYKIMTILLTNIIFTHTHTHTRAHIYYPSANLSLKRSYLTLEWTHLMQEYTQRRVFILTF